ncbi:MAG: inositol monophosphatase family protein [Acidimicrobiales bacterium]
MTDATFDIAAHLDEVADMVRSASVLSLEWYRQIDNRIDNKASAGFDPVTEADRAVESDLRRRLSERFPGHAILGEEFGTTGGGRYRWIIDPIDGTRAFITGQPMWGTLLGFQDEGRPVAGWMHVPPLNESYVGHTECSFITADARRTVTVSGTTALAEATLLCTHPTMFAAGWEAAAFAELADQVKLVRYSGDCLNYGLLAMGLADLVVENQLANYDILPLIPIIESAGGIVTDLDGKLPVDGGFVVAAATGELHDAALGMLNANR